MRKEKSRVLPPPISPTVSYGSFRIRIRFGSPRRSARRTATLVLPRFSTDMVAVAVSPLMSTGGLIWMPVIVTSEESASAAAAKMTGVQMMMRATMAR